jgi:hypothetical protein
MPRAPFSRSNQLLFGVCLATSVLLAACPSDEPADPPPPVPDLGADPAVPAGPGEVRAGVIREGDAGQAGLIGGIASEGRAGDIKLFNERVQFVIQGIYAGHGYIEGGGTVIDMDRVRPEGQLGRDFTDELFLAFSVGRLFRAQTVELVNDGSDGNPAVVRATGIDVVWDLVQGTMEADEPLIDDLHLSIVQEYELAPDSWSLKVSTTFTNTGDEPNRFNPADAHMGSEEESVPWASGQGLNENADDDALALGAAGKHGEGVFSIWPDEGVLNPINATMVLGATGLTSLTGHRWIDLEPGASDTLVRHYSFGPDSATVEAERRRLQGESLGSVSGTVTAANGGQGLAGVRVHFTSTEAEPETVIGFAVTGSDGGYEAELPPGDWLAWAVAAPVREHVQLPLGAGRYGPFTAPLRNQEVLDVLTGVGSAEPIPWAEARPTPDAFPFSVSANAPTVTDLAMEDGATLVLDITDDDGQPLAAVVEVRWADGGTGPTDPVPEALRRAIGLDGPSERAAWAWTGGGQLELPILPGSVDLKIGSGFRHERATVETVELVAGSATSRSVVLPRVLQHDGWFAVDTHLHGAPSPDGSLPMEDRLITCASAGVDVPVTTDHDRLADYRPLAAALGLADMMVMPGVEVSPVLRGHFNLFPVEPQGNDAQNGGAVSWWLPSPTTDELIERMRDSAGATEQTLVQVNHGRSPGMLSMAGYDPTSGGVGNEHLFSLDFDVMEVVSGNSWMSWEDLRTDWMSFLNLGHIKIPTGGSDSHNRTKVCGYGRTDVYVGVESVADLDSTAVRDALAAGHVVVGGGVTLRATLDVGSGPILPGDTTQGSAGFVNVEVSGPSWIHPELLRIYRNGVVVHEQTLESASGAVIFEGDIPIEADGDSWFAAEVEGGDGMGHAYGGARPYALTMAWFVDVDGGGWEPPGL